MDTILPLILHQGKVLLRGRDDVVASWQRGMLVKMVPPEKSPMMYQAGEMALAVKGTHVHSCSNVVQLAVYYYLAVDLELLVLLLLASVGEGWAGHLASWSEEMIVE